MKRLLGFGLAVLFSLAFLVPAALAGNPLPHTGRVLMAVGGDITVPAGDRADAVIVVNGTATISGEVNAIVVIDGAVDLAGARAETIVAVRSPVDLGSGTVVLGDVMTFDSVVHQATGVQVQGHVSDMAATFVGIGAVLAPALFLLWLGSGLAVIVAGLALAGLAPRQVRDAEALITHEPVLTLVAGFIAIVLIPVVAIALMATLIGAPLGFGILFAAWPLVAFVGYLVAGIWVGEWALRHTTAERVRDRPYLASAVGLLLLAVLTIVPVLGLITVVASLFGFGAVIRLALRGLRSTSVSRPTIASPSPAPLAG